MGEAGYLAVLARVLEAGEETQDRTQVGTRSVFAPPPLKFDVGEAFPLLTTKKVFWRGVVEELLFFLRGSTNSKELERAGVHIWRGNTSREFLDRAGLAHLPSGDIGAGYSFQWRHFGAAYHDCTEDYTGEGFDQIAYVVNELIEAPWSRRIFMSAWNPAALHEMALPPCHVSCQFKVYGARISACVYMRSVDLFLGAPFNIASYALLLSILAHALDLAPAELTLCLGDAHLYTTHLDAATEQLARAPFRPPTLAIATKPAGRTVAAVLEWIGGLTFADFRLSDYVHHPPIAAPMAI